MAAVEKSMTVLLVTHRCHNLTNKSGAVNKMPPLVEMAALVKFLLWMPFFASAFRVVFRLYIPHYLYNVKNGRVVTIHHFSWNFVSIFMKNCPEKCFRRTALSALIATAIHDVLVRVRIDRYEYILASNVEFRNFCTRCLAASYSLSF